MSRNVYQKLCDGDHLTNMEINKAIDHYTTAEKALLKLGPCFEISRKAITMSLITLQDIQIARARDRITRK